MRNCSFTLHLLFCSFSQRERESLNLFPLSQLTLSFMIIKAVEVGCAFSVFVFSLHLNYFQVRDLSHGKSIYSICVLMNTSVNLWTCPNSDLTCCWLHLSQDLSVCQRMWRGAAVYSIHLSMFPLCLLSTSIVDCLLQTRPPTQS